MADFEFGIVEEAPREPHIFAPIITKLIADTEQNPRAVVFYNAANEDDAKLTLRKLQAAAKEQDRSARRRSTVKLDDGTIRVGVGIGERITRNRGESADADAAEVAEAVEATSPKSAKK